MTESYPTEARLSWRAVVMNLGLAVAAIVAWRLGAPELLVGSFLGSAGMAGLNGWRR